MLSCEDFILLLDVSFRGTTEEVQEAGSILTQIEPTFDVLTFIFQIALSHESIPTKAAALIRLYHYIRDSWQKYDVEMKNFICTNFIPILETCYRIIPNIVKEIAEFLVNNAYFTGEWTHFNDIMRINLIFHDLTEDVMPAYLMIIQCVFKHFENYVESENSLFINLATEYIEVTSLYIQDNNNIQCLTTIYKILLSIFKRENKNMIIIDQQLINIWISKKDLLIETNECMNFAYYYMKFIYFMLERYQVLFESNIVWSIFIQICPLITYSITSKSWYYYINILRISFGYPEIWNSMQCHIQCLIQVMINIMAITEPEIEMAINDPRTFINENHNTIECLFEKKYACKYLISEIQEQRVEFVNILFSIVANFINNMISNEEASLNDCAQFYSAVNLISPAISSFFNLNNKVSTELAGSVIQLCSHTNFLVRAAAFNFLSFSYNNCLQNECIIPMIEHLQDEFYIVRFFAILALKTHLIKLNDVHSIQELCLPYTRIIFSSFVELSQQCLDTQLVNFIKPFLNIFGEMIAEETHSFMDLLLSFIVEFSNDEYIDPDDEPESIVDDICYMLKLVKDPLTFELFLSNVLVFMESAPLNYIPVLCKSIESILINTPEFNIKYWIIINVLIARIKENKNQYFIDSIATFKYLLIRSQRENIFDLEMLTLLFENAINQTDNENNGPFAIKLISYILIACQGSEFANQILLSQVLKDIVNEKSDPELIMLIGSMIIANPTLFNNQYSFLIPYWIDEREFPFFVIPTINLMNIVEESIKYSLALASIQLVVEEQSADTNCLYDISDGEDMEFNEYNEEIAMSQLKQFVEQISKEYPQLTYTNVQYDENLYKMSEYTDSTEFSQPEAVEDYESY